MVLLLVQVVIWGFAAALLAVTLLPLSGSHAWWVRMWDFPRVHIAGGLAVLIPASALLPDSFVLVPALAAALVYQLWRIYPFTPLARSELAFAPDAPDGVTLLAANVLMENDRYDKVIALIDEVDPDVLLLMETDARWIEALAPALARYATVVREPRDDYYGLVFATRLAAAEARSVHLTPDETPTLLAELTTAQGASFRFVGLHPQPPVPGQDTEERDAQIIYAARFARKTDMPMVTMGDFNDAAWSDTSQKFKRGGGFVDPRIGRGLFASFNANHPMIRCPIDQIYVTADIAVVGIALRHHVGSDHLPLSARIRLDPDLAARHNIPPKPLGAAEDARLDAIASAYGKRLEAVDRD